MITRLRSLHRPILFGLCTMLCVLFAQRAYSESYMLSVGESVTITQSAYGGGYIDNVGLADYIDPHLEFEKTWDNSAKITIRSYFDYSTTVKLVFIERYTFMGHTRAATYYRDVTITCKYQAPDPSKKPTKVMLPERIRIPVFNGGERDYISAILEPKDAVPSKYSWGNSQGTAVFAAREMSDGRYWLTGRSPGVGSIYVVVDDDWDNLYAHSVLEVVDPNHLPPNAVFLPNEIEISVGGHSTLTPILVPENTSTAYTWKSDNEDVATVSYGKVVGKKVGTTTIKVITTNSLTATCKVKVVSTNGKDDEDDDNNNTTGIIGGHEYADLGLSVKWATCNVGASSPENYGSYFAWGETSPKSSYNWDTYKHCSGSIMNLYNIGTDIKGTQYDAAYVNWGNQWRMPTEVEIGELLSKCNITEYNRNGIDGYLLTGPNGGSIFLPSGGMKKNSDVFTGAVYCWSSNVRSSDDNASSLLLEKNPNGTTSTVYGVMRCFGLPIRAVTESSGQTVLQGDVNGDGDVTPLDLVSMVNMILKKTAKKDSADLNGDGDVTPLDYVKLVNILLKKQ